MMGKWKKSADYRTQQIHKTRSYRQTDSAESRNLIKHTKSMDAMFKEFQQISGSVATMNRFVRESICSIIMGMLHPQTNVHQVQ